MNTPHLQPAAECQEDGPATVPANPPLWLTLLLDAVATHPKGKLGVAGALGISRPYVSRVLTGSIPVPPQKFIDRVLRTYQRVDCPHLGTSLAHSDCVTHASRPYAALSHMEVDHWRACQRCAHRPASAAGAAAPVPALNSTGTSTRMAPIAFLRSIAPAPAGLTTGEQA